MSYKLLSWLVIPMFTTTLWWTAVRVIEDAPAWWLTGVMFVVFLVTLNVRVHLLDKWSERRRSRKGVAA